MNSLLTDFHFNHFNLRILSCRREWIEELRFRLLSLYSQYELVHFSKEKTKAWNIRKKIGKREQERKGEVCVDFFHPHFCAYTFIHPSNKCLSPTYLVAWGWLPVRKLRLWYVQRRVHIPPLIKAHINHRRHHLDIKSPLHWYYATE